MLSFLRALLNLLLLPFAAIQDFFTWLRPARPQVQEPPPPDAPTADPARTEAASQAVRQASTLGEALDVRRSARSILRGDAVEGSPAPVLAWLRSMTKPALLAVCSMPPEDMSLLLAGNAVRGVPGYDAGAAERAAIGQRLRDGIAASRRAAEHPAPRPLTDDERRDAFHAAVESRIARHATGAARGPGVPA